MPPVRVSSTTILCIVALGASGCLGAGKWTPAPIGSGSDELSFREAAQSPDDTQAAKDRTPQIPDIPVRKKARFCCAFGTELQVKFGKMPVPWVKIGRILNLRELGPHRYDGATAAIDDDRENAFPRGEHNGLLYTCRGGFIDTAHVRETVDWAAYFVGKLDRHIDHGIALDLGDEGGDRHVIVEAVPPELIHKHGRDRLVVEMAQWMAHQVMAWHEIAQWYGWSVMALYPESVSGFSPEDMYSNAVGVRLLDGVDIRQSLVSEKVYNRHMDALITADLARLDPVPKDVGTAAVHAVDQVWWNSEERLPEKSLVMRRYLNTGNELEPWLLPRQYASAELRASLNEACGPNPKPTVIHIPYEAEGVPFSEFMTLEIQVEDRLAKQSIFQSMGGRVSQNDFPYLLDRIRVQNREEFGLRADLPD